MFCVFVLIWGKCFADRIWVKNKSGLFNSEFQVKCWNVEIVTYFHSVLLFLAWFCFPITFLLQCHVFTGMVNLEMPVIYYRLQCVKSVCIGSFSGPYFPGCGLKTERNGVSLCIHSESGKYGPEKLRIRTLFMLCWDTSVASRVAERLKPSSQSENFFNTNEKLLKTSYWTFHVVHCLTSDIQFISTIFSMVVVAFSDKK